MADADGDPYSGMDGGDNPAATGDISEGGYICPVCGPGCTCGSSCTCAPGCHGDCRPA